MEQSKPIVTFYKIFGTFCLVAGIICNILFGAISFEMITDDVDDSFGNFIEMCIGFIICIILIGIGKTYISMVSDFKIYMSWLAVNKTRSIEKLADGMGLTQEIIISNLNQMIKSKILKGAYIDMETNQIIFPDDYITVECQSCGAINKIKPGIGASCEYCGAYIK